MKTAKLFKNGKSQAVRLPKHLRFAGEEVICKKFGPDGVLLLPVQTSWDNLIEGLKGFSPDFMSDREQPHIQKREPL